MEVLRRHKKVLAFLHYFLLSGNIYFERKRSILKGQSVLPRFLEINTGVHVSVPEQLLGFFNFFYVSLLRSKQRTGLPFA